MQDLVALPVSAAEELPERVIAILSEVAEDNLTLDSELMDGIDSLGATLVINNIQMQLGVNITAEDEEPSPSPASPSRLEIVEKVLSILNEVADEDESMCLDTALLDGIDSLGSTLVINNIQASFGVVMNITDWMDSFCPQEMENAGDLANFVVGLVEAQAPVPILEKMPSKAKPSRPREKQKARLEDSKPPQVPSQLSASVSGVKVLRQGIGPRVFLVDAHPPEAEELAGLEKVQEKRAELAAALAPCTVCSLIFDEEACRCKSLAELVRLYTRRVNAHRMIYADKAGVQDVRLILFKDPLLLPEPSQDVDDEWRGGAIEAVLFTACACGASKWAREERRRLRERGRSRQLNVEDEVEDMQMRLFWEEGAKPGHLQRLGPKRFAELANATGRKVDLLQSLTRLALPNNFEAVNQAKTRRPKQSCATGTCGLSRSEIGEAASDAQHMVAKEKAVKSSRRLDWIRLDKQLAVFHSMKRLLGRTYEEAHQIGLRPSELGADPSGQAREIVRLLLPGGRVISVEEVVAVLIKELVKIAENYLGQPIKRAILGVPVRWNKYQKRNLGPRPRNFKGKVEIEATAQRLEENPYSASAEELDTFRESMKKIQNPTAKHILVADLGGGTFDVCIVRQWVEWDEIHIQFTSGDERLGGNDFDNALTTWKPEMQRLKKWPLSRESQDELRILAKKAKERLSSSDSAEILFGPFKATVTRDNFRVICLDVLKRLLVPIREAAYGSHLRLPFESLAEEALDVAERSTKRKKRRMTERDLRTRSKQLRSKHQKGDVEDDDEIMIDEILLIGAATWKLGLMIELLQVQVASKHQMH
eukprot:g26202.t1